MPRPSPHVRLLLRGTAALVGFAVVWWLFLVTPLVGAFRQSAEFLGTVAFGRFPCETGSETASGNLRFCVPVSVVVPDRETGGPSRASVAEFEVARTGLFPFTFGLPVYWALFWAVRPHRWVRPLVVGTGLTALAEILLLLVFLKTYAHVLLAQSNPFASQTANWFYFLGQYLAVNAGPMVAPFVIALALQGELRAQVLGWVEEPARVGRDTRRGADRLRLMPPTGRGRGGVRARGHCG